MDFLANALASNATTFFNNFLCIFFLYFQFTNHTLSSLSVAASLPNIAHTPHMPGVHIRWEVPR